MQRENRMSSTNSKINEMPNFAKMQTTMDTESYSETRGGMSLGGFLDTKKDGTYLSKVNDC